MISLKKFILRATRRHPTLGKAMNDHDTEPSDMLPFLEEKSSQFSQTSSLKEPALSQLRDQIKKVMIPLLIKTFQFKLELSQSL